VHPTGEGKKVVMEWHIERLKKWCVPIAPVNRKLASGNQKKPRQANGPITARAFSASI
jgi:hypothetical protein